MPWPAQLSDSCTRSWCDAARHRFCAPDPDANHQCTIEQVVQDGRDFNGGNAPRCLSAALSVLRVLSRARLAALIGHLRGNERERLTLRRKLRAGRPELASMSDGVLAIVASLCKCKAILQCA